MRRAAKVDDNQAEIVAALRRAGCSVCILSGVGNGCPDLAVGLRGVTYLLEVKDGSKCPSKRRLTAGEQQWHEKWRGHVAVVNSVDDALDAVGLWPCSTSPGGTIEMTRRIDQESRLPVVDGKVGQGVPFERIRRITGYLVGTLDRFNNAKRAEEKDRVKHG